MRAVRLGSAQEKPSIDGRLDELAWLAAPATGGLRQREPGEGAAASEDTEVRILYDDKTLFIGISARDHEPAKVIARILQRDRLFDAGFDGTHRFAGDDGVAILLDPFHDQRNAIVFATNPNGAQFDALITDESGVFNVDWRAVWDVAAARTKDGWTAEFAIPFRSLRYPAGEASEPWGINVFRMLRRNGLFYTRAFTHLDEAFELSDRVPVPVGDYAWRDAGVFFRTSPNRPAFLRGFVDRQRNWGGRVDATEGHLGFAAGPHLTLSLGLTHTSAELPGGAFDADLASLRFGWVFSTRLTASGFVQWNSLDRKLVTNLRLNFIHRPGSDLYVVLNDERGSELEPRKLTNRGLAVKLTWLARF